MKKKFRGIRMSKANLLRLDTINSIIEEYQKEDYVLTLRQLYYQLVSRDIIPNKQSEYSKLSTLLKEGRMAGVVDWDAIEDRVRKPNIPSGWDSPASILDTAISAFEVPRQTGQNKHIEVWIEKDALSGVVSRITEQYHVPLMVNRGYSSVSAMHDSYMRFVRADKPIVILYLGDFDPSGMDMVRDIEDRIIEFRDGSHEENHVSKLVHNFSIKRIALTWEQIQQYNPPPNPAKTTDPRATDFIAQYGAESYEVDALPPSVLSREVDEHIRQNMDMAHYNYMLLQEEVHLKTLKDFRATFSN